MRVCHQQKLQRALKRQCANSLVDRAIRDLVLARRRLLAKNSKSLSRPSGKPLMRVCRPPKLQHALKRRLTNSLVGRVIRDLVLARRRLQARNSKSLSRHSGWLLMRVCRLPKRLLVLIKMYESSCL